MGVSKSSVSKWETGQTYPDIYLLPELATFFNISIDSLMAYKPQLDKFQIRDIYVEFSEKFGKEPFDTVFEEYKLIVKNTMQVNDFFCRWQCCYLIILA